MCDQFAVSWPWRRVQQLARASLEQYSLAKSRRIALAATRKFDDSNGDGFAFAGRILWKLESVTRLIEGTRHRVQGLRIEHGLASQKWNNGAHPVPIRRLKANVPTLIGRAEPNCQFLLWFNILT